MHKLRVIARLDIKNDTVVKGIQLEGLRVVGAPNELAYEYYQQGADELIYIDAVASLYDRNSLIDVIKKTAKRIFIPLTVGGGIRTLDDIRELLSCGADKVAINTSAIRNPTFIRDAVKQFGSQCIILSVEAKKTLSGWYAYTESGREPSSYQVPEWIEEAIRLGAGEVLLTSVDKDGSQKGFDLDLIQNVANLCSVPLTVSGGAGSANDILKLVSASRIDAVSVGSVLHYKNCTVQEIKSFLSDNQVDVR